MPGLTRTYAGLTCADMDLLELFFMVPDLFSAIFYLFRGLWWLVRGTVAVVWWAARGIGRGARSLVDRVRGRDPGFPTAIVVRHRPAP
jgi:hypothetical protein